MPRLITITSHHAYLPIICGHTSNTQSIQVPYNQPESAYDLLTRFLSKKSFIDEKLPQIRVPDQQGNYPISNKAETSTTATPESGNALSMMDAAIASPSSFDESASIPNFGESSGGVVNGDNSSNHNQMVLSHWHVGLISFLVGMFFAVVAVRLQDRNRSRRSSYQRIPDSTI